MHRPWRGSDRRRIRPELRLAYWTDRDGHQMARIRGRFAARHIGSATLTVVFERGIRLLQIPVLISMEFTAGCGYTSS